MFFKWQHYRISILPHRSYKRAGLSIIQIYNSLDPTEAISADISEAFTDQVIDLLTIGGNLGLSILVIKTLIGPNIARRVCLN